MLIKYKDLIYRAYWEYAVGKDMENGLWDRQHQQL